MHWLWYKRIGGERDRHSPKRARFFCAHIPKNAFKFMNANLRLLPMGAVPLT